MILTYKAFDGKEFNTADACLEYERGAAAEYANVFKGELSVSRMFKVDVHAIDTLITKFLKIKGFSNKNFDKYGYESIAENEWGNYQSHDFSVESEMPDKEEIEDKGGMSTGEILNWICADGLIEEGEYLIDCSW